MSRTYRRGGRRADAPAPRISLRVWLAVGALGGVAIILAVTGRPSTNPGVAGGPEVSSAPESLVPDRSEEQNRTVTGQPLRAFTQDSWWNTEVPADAPLHPQAATILDYMSSARESGGGCVTLAGAENSWGQPVYWAAEGDTEYDVNVPRVDEPPELSALRIPAGAKAAETSDRAMTVFDLDKGYVVALTGAFFNTELGIWRASGATVTYLDSNGLDSRAAGSDDDRNSGTHRGNNGATMMVRYDEVMAGEVGHVVKVASGPEMSTKAVWPMVGSDGDSQSKLAPEQGMRFRLKPSVDLAALDLHPQARVIAEGLQKFGFYLGDSAGTTALKLENTRAQDSGLEWALPADALCGLPLSPALWDVLPPGYDPSR